MIDYFQKFLYFLLLVVYLRLTCHKIKLKTLESLKFDIPLYSTCFNRWITAAALYELAPDSFTRDRADITLRKFSNSRLPDLIRTCYQSTPMFLPQAAQLNRSKKKRLSPAFPGNHPGTEPITKFSIESM